jgi:hypothetical protein
MLLQTNSYIVPKDKRAEHARLLRRFRQVLTKLGCDNFEVYEQVGANWSTGESTGRVVQIMRFRDRRHQLAVQAAERNDPAAQALIAEFCELINFPYQQQRGLFAVGYYGPVLTSTPVRDAEEQPTTEIHETPVDEAPDEQDVPAPAAAGVVEAGAAAAEALVEETPVEAPSLAGRTASFSEAIVPAEEIAEAGAPAGELPSEAAVEETPITAAEPTATPPDATGPGAAEPVIDVPLATDPAAHAGSDEPVTDDDGGPDEEMDLSALLDPHLDHNERNMVPPPLPRAANGDNGTPPGHRPELDLSLEGLLDDENGSPDDTGSPAPEGRQNMAHGASRG